MSRKYFGTDGIRGRVGEAPMTPDFALKLGWAAGKVLAPKKGRAKVVIGKDTRLSGYMFESVLEAGFSAAGVDVILLGPMPTPGIAYLTRTVHASAGVVISASHNLFQDNGVKFFDNRGYKLPDAIEHKIEALLDQPLRSVAPEELGRARRMSDATGRYIEFCKSTFRRNTTLVGLRIAVDCANGATYNVAPSVFREMGAEVHVIGNHPDGLNINHGCGSTHVGALQKAAREYEADIGIALDGDGDRCILVDAGGRIVDGDEILYVLARARKADGKLKGPVVGTLMSNLGLELALKGEGIEFARAKVGDRYVMEMLAERGGMLGGESSGHILCLDRVTSGDGIVSALQVLAVMVSQKKSLRALLTGLEKCPQILVNVKLQGGKSQTVMDSPSVKQAVVAVEKELGKHGRVLLRPSGTEPLIRVMVEGLDPAKIKSQAERIADAVRGAAA
ncbi:MAG: phosphoglucosamine mutase [Nevskiales bacterium]